MLSAEEIVSQQDRETCAWHQAAAGVAKPGSGTDWLSLVSGQHCANFELWHIEDEARVPGATDAEIAAVKRRVDSTNQRRNDLAEGLDSALLAWLEPRGLPNPAAALHSETPGLMIDRLAILEEQRADLAVCLDALWGEILGGTKRFKLYRQLKMYNDPSLNPAVYGNSGAAGQAKLSGGSG
jgi:hypothetical protein